MTRGISTLLGSVLAVAGIVVGLPTLAYAQSGPPEAQTSASDTDVGLLKEIVVTAQRRSQKMVDVPISVTALNSKELATANVQSLADIAQLVPSLRFDSQTDFFQPMIRGIGTAVTTSGGGTDVGVYVDGFYSPNPLAANFQLLNVTSIQVLKGPQGTLFGHNTTGGAILVTTAEPSTQPHAEIKASYGSFAAQRYQLYATTGLTQNVAVDIAGIFSKGDGFVTNIFDNDDHVGAYKNWTLRTGLKIQLSDKLSVLARFTHSQEDDPTSMLINSNTDSSINPTTGAPWGVQTFMAPGTYTTNPNQVALDLPTFATTRSSIAQLTVKADLDFADLTSYSQWRKTSTNASENLDQTSQPIFQLGLPVFDTTVSQEILLNSKRGTRLQWTAGVFAFSNSDKWLTDINTLGGLPLGGSGTVTQNYAAYLDATYALTHRLFLTVGARYSRDIVKDAYYRTYFTLVRNYVPNIESNKVTPRVVLRYKLTDDSNVYASYTEGYKAAIIDVGGSCQDPPAFKCNPIRPEDVDAFEVGYKVSTPRFSNDAAAFYYNYKDLQVSEFLEGAAQAYIVNAAKSRIYGLEDEFRYAMLANHVQISAGASWTHARYLTFGSVVNGAVVGTPIYATCNPAAGVPPQYAAACPAGSYDYVNTSTILHGTHMQYTPDLTATLTPRVTTGMTPTGEYSLSGNLYFTSKFYFSPSGTQFEQPGYATLSLRADWMDPSQRYTIAVYGDNVTSKRYRTQVQYNGYGIGASWSAPATWGVEVGASF